MSFGRVDINQNGIVKALRAAGCSVHVLSNVGKGCPDLLVARNGVNYLLEVKNGAAKPSDRELTADQFIWHREWRGQVCVVMSVDEALRAVGLSVAA